MQKNDWINVLCDLKKENPNIPIVTYVDSDVVCDDHYGFYLGQIKEVKLGKMCQYNDDIYDDEDSLIESYLYDHDNISATWDEIRSATKNWWHKVIVVVVEPFDGCINW